MFGKKYILFNLLYFSFSTLYFFLISIIVLIESMNFVSLSITLNSSKLKYYEYFLHISSYQNTIIISILSSSILWYVTEIKVFNHKNTRNFFSLLNISTTQNNILIQLICYFWPCNFHCASWEKFTNCFCFRNTTPENYFYIFLFSFHCFSFFRLYF